jgi:hypothetical protein
MFGAEIRKRRVAHMRWYPKWRWRLDEVFVKVNGKLCYLWRAVDHESEVLEAVVSAKRDKAAALKFLKRATRTYGDRGASSQAGLLLLRGDERDRQCRSPGGRSSAQQSRGEFESAVSTTRMGHAAVSKHEALQNSAQFMPRSSSDQV